MNFAVPAIHVLVKSATIKPSEIKTWNFNTNARFV
jgi:hypothetical protein